MDRFNHCRGFTLVELMASLVLVAILVTMAAPAFQDMYIRNKTYTKASQWLSVLNLLRSEAVKRNIQVSLCPSMDGASCDDELDWQDGWIMFTDPNRNGDFEAATELILNTGGSFSGSYVLVATRHKDWFGYRPDGTAVGNSGSGNTTFLMCKPGAEQSLSRRVVISVVGRPRIDAGSGGKECI